MISACRFGQLWDCLPRAAPVSRLHMEHSFRDNATVRVQDRYDHQLVTACQTIHYLSALERTSFQVYYKTSQRPEHPPSGDGKSPFVDSVFDV